jgi:small conductance mechanosensitive channel
MPDDFWTTVGVFFATFAGKLVICLIIAAVAFLVSWILRFVIRYVVRRIVNGVKKNQNVQETSLLTASPLAAVRLVQRTRTLGTVLSNIVNVVIAIIALILVVNTIDKSILGSFALLSAAIGAGLGFGAQNLVKDVLNGLLMVAEDQLGVGDVVDTGLATGVVEAVGIRVTQLRDVNGTLWFVRNGEMLRVGNMSQGWARAIIDVPVPYDADVDAVQDQLLAMATAMADEPEWKTKIIEAPAVWGIQSISAEAIMLRLVVKTRTSAKDEVARELRSRLRKLLHELELKVPSLNNVVITGPDGLPKGGTK